MAFPYPTQPAQPTQPVPPASVPQTAPLDPISEQSWAMLTILELVKVLEQPQDQKPAELVTHARKIVDELKAYRAVAAAVNALVKP